MCYSIIKRCLIRLEKGCCGSDGFDGKNGVIIISNIEWFFRERKELG